MRLTAGVLPLLLALAALGHATQPPPALLSSFSANLRVTYSGFIHVTGTGSLHLSSSLRAVRQELELGERRSRVLQRDTCLYDVRGVNDSCFVAHTDEHVVDYWKVPGDARLVEGDGDGEVQRWAVVAAGQAWEVRRSNVTGLWLPVRYEDAQVRVDVLVVSEGEPDASVFDVPLEWGCGDTQAVCGERKAAAKSLRTPPRMAPKGSAYFQGHEGKTKMHGMVAWDFITLKHYEKETEGMWSEYEIRNRDCEIEYKEWGHECTSEHDSFAAEVLLPKDAVYQGQTKVDDEDCAVWYSRAEDEVWYLGSNWRVSGAYLVRKDERDEMTDFYGFDFSDPNPQWFKVRSNWFDCPSCPSAKQEKPQEAREHFGADLAKLARKLVVRQEKRAKRSA